MPEVNTAGQKAPAWRLWALNGGVLLASFLCAGLATVIPQWRVLELISDQKAFWLPLCLLLGTLGAIVGTLAGGIWWERALSARWLLMPLGGVAVGVWALFAVQEPRQFLVGYVLVCALANLLITRFDHVASRMAAPGSRVFNDRLGTVCRLLGMLIGPWFFSQPLNRVSVGVVGLVSALGALIGWFASMRTPALPVSSGTAAGTGRLEGRDFLVLGHAVTVYAALYLFAANLSYFLRDSLGLDHAGSRAGLLIVAVFLAAVVVVPLASAPPFRLSEGRLRQFALVPTVPLVVALGLYEGRAVVTYPVMVWIAAALGAGYGLFLLGLRDHVSRSAREGKPVMLTIYNNLANVSALLAFAGMLLLARLEPGSTEAYYHAWMRLLAAVSVTGLPFLVLAGHRLTRRSLVPGDTHP